MSEIEIPPQTEIYGIAYADGTTGGWHRDRREVVKMIRDVRRIGLGVMFLIRLRMRRETLWASE